MVAVPLVLALKARPGGRVPDPLRTGTGEPVVVTVKALYCPGAPGSWGAGYDRGAAYRDPLDVGDDRHGVAARRRVDRPVDAERQVVPARDAAGSHEDHIVAVGTGHHRGHEGQRAVGEVADQVGRRRRGQDGPARGLSSMVELPAAMGALPASR